MPVRIGSTQKKQRRRTFLREWREAKNLTQATAAERFGMSQAQLSRIESGKSDMTLGFLEIAADAYGTTVSSLLDRHPDQPSREKELEDRMEQLRTLVGDAARKTGT